MQLTSTWRSYTATDSGTSRTMDSSSPDELEPLASDKELFIRRTFETDARMGCELLFRQHYVALCSHAVRFVGSKAIAEDLVADMFCQFYEQQIFATISTSYRAYLYKTVRNRAFNYVRQTFRRDVPLDEAQYQAITETQQPDAITQYDELYQDVEKAIESLPVQRRRIYLMNRFEGKKYGEIAGELGLSTRTIEVQIRLASHALRELLKGRWFLLILLGIRSLF
ncbi:RNA polymerase sigma-70 factor [Spirosoma sp. KCTC 42546]|uniref:RNA polymerase sigma-70 factor n=1 Tax=Spirosoma sp. KCTC 42546 TaxID=2520506 RepID=UPI001156E626|nr:RNA polymerase sigma-70 factor [Spirosoma sp. KCTC 42546]QDK79278.1 RNA polymerase sigma-70 factor [Spirosoma sp. KCTC 42546]